MRACVEAGLTATLSDGEESGPDPRPSYLPLGHSPGRRVLGLRTAIAASLVLAATAGLVYGFVSGSNELQHEPKRGEVVVTEVSDEIEGLYMTTCSGCHFGNAQGNNQCECGWASQPGACQKPDPQCCWACCCGQQGNSWADQGVDDQYSQGYDCNAAYGNWQLEWSGEKKQYCCLSAGLGCSGASYSHVGGSYDCDAGFGAWQGDWSEAKRTYCCMNTGKGCDSYYGAARHRYSRYTGGYVNGDQHYFWAFLLVLFVSLCAFAVVYGFWSQGGSERGGLVGN